jgi:hypothetical protein
MMTRAAMVDSYICVTSFGKSLDADDFHLFTAPTRGAFGTAWGRHAIKRRHWNTNMLMGKLRPIVPRRTNTFVAI